MRIVRFVVALALLAAGLGATAAPAMAWPPGQVGSASINSTVFAPGGTVVVSVQNTRPGPLVMQIFSAPVTIGTGTVGPNGQGSVSGPIPAGYSGAHTIQVTGNGGEVYQFQITVRRTGSGGFSGWECTRRHGYAYSSWIGDGLTPGAPYTMLESGTYVVDRGTADSSGFLALSGEWPTHHAPASLTLVTDGNVVDSYESPIDTDCGTQSDGGLFRSVSPARVLDTRVGNGAPRVKVGPGRALTVQVTGRGGLPATGVGSVVMNATVTNSTGSGYISIYPAGGARPVVSSLNFVAGQTVPNAATVPVGTDGKITFYNGSGGTVDLVADVSGYFLAGDPGEYGSFVSIAPDRLLDTRSGNGAPKAKIGPGQSLTVTFGGRGDLPGYGILGPDVGSVVMNATVVNPSGSGYLTAFPAGADRPLTSSLNFVAGKTVPNAVTVPVGDDLAVTFYNGSTGSIDLLADVSGYYRAGNSTQPGAFVSLTPARVLDTRNGTGAPKAVVARGAELTVPLTGRGGLPAGNVASVVLNATVTNPTGNGYITVYPAGGERPVVSSLNFVARQTIPNAVTVPVGTAGKITLYNGSSGTVDLLADVAGYYLAAAAG